jgi:L-cysteine:1D-myo-inositol 2-amino-2-deoxy-alpha-D-glucopyranoside ligase
MAMSWLGPSIDLHGGGRDLIYPHHECEIAQTEACTGQPFSRHWMHTGLVAYQGEKMSKSRGNLVFVSELVKQHDPRAIRWAVLAHHYRADWEWNDEEMVAASADLDRLVEAASRPTGPSPGGLVDDVRRALDDDLDTPAAWHLLRRHAEAVLAGGDDPTSAAALAAGAELCGIDLTAPLA